LGSNVSSFPWQSLSRVGSHLNCLRNECICRDDQTTRNQVAISKIMYCATCVHVTARIPPK
jgi:hypothetical protein